MLIRKKHLDEFLKNSQVTKYYTILRRKKMALLFKRVFDILVSLVMIIILSPILLFFSVWVKLDSEGPVFYRQIRVTKNNRDFKIFKFRTMVENADQIGALVTMSADRRITKVGSKLRDSRMDELPQLFNILKGEMTFVGTRPEVRKYVDQYDDDMKATLLLPAGVTSLASIMFKDEAEIMNDFTNKGLSIDQVYIEKILPRKMEYNLNEISNYSFFKDIHIMFKTAMEVLK